MGEIESLMKSGLFVRKPSQTAQAKIGDGAICGGAAVPMSYVVLAVDSTTVPAKVPVHWRHCCIQSPTAVQFGLEQWRDGWTQSGAGMRRGPYPHGHRDPSISSGKPHA